VDGVLAGVDDAQAVVKDGVVALERQSEALAVAVDVDAHAVVEANGVVLLGRGVRGRALVPQVLRVHRHGVVVQRLEVRDVLAQART
jgi:hypothetical protein